jgi:dihydroflavonol-4-reductase
VQKNIKGQNYIVISENICYKKINEWITSSIPKYHVKPFVTNVLYRLDWLFSKLFFTKRKITKSLHLSLHSISIYSNEKVVATLNYEFEKVENTIKRIMLLKKGN